MILKWCVAGLKNLWAKFAARMTPLATKFSLVGIKERLKRWLSFWKRSSQQETSSEK